MNKMKFFDKKERGVQETIYSVMKKSQEDCLPLTKQNDIKEIISVPFNMISKGYKELHSKIEQNNDKNGNVGLYRPIASCNEEELSTFSYKNSSSPTEDVIRFTPDNNFIHLNAQTLMFEKFVEMSSEMFEHPNDYEHTTLPIVNEHFPYNNHKNNNKGKYGYYDNKHRFDYQIKQNGSHNGNNRDKRRRSPNYYHSNNADPMIRRVHGLTHRFKSRSDIMKIDPNPPQLLNGGPYDQLSQAIYDVFTSKAQKTETYESKIQLWKDLFLYIRRCVSHYALYIVGSTMTGFGLNSSDIDMCLLIRPCTEDPRLDSLQQLHYIKNYLLKYGLIIHSELILAKVPILKFREETRGFEIDLNCNNAVGIYNTHLLYSYARCDWRVRPLVIMVKLWAQANGINDAKNLTVSSYSWTLMLIHYLQCGVSPAVLPCLHTLYPEHFNVEKYKITDVHADLEYLEKYESFNTQSLAELFIGKRKYENQVHIFRYLANAQIFL
ncbi:hypothetical protein ABEB36_005315 [Hypothenemus hampei]|uniref:Poly(A) RNA polymerase mitochondrial-like central palm domain-containing protein n=1 Tax=Hypothenemus hampei TaxID=57062 RepID=A0ABD1EXT5_HYPHA